jgi:hypothetical protein
MFAALFLLTKGKRFLYRHPDEAPHRFKQLARAFLRARA